MVYTKRLYHIKMSDEDFTSTPQEIKDIAQNVTENLLPTKSKKLYNKSYENFMEWRVKSKVSSFSENVLLAYFQEMSTKYSPATLWSDFSMVKSTLKIYHQTDISKYNKLYAFLKRKSEGYKAKKSKTFLPEEINTFINEAPDEVFLLTKVAVIFGILGACRRQELHSLQYDNVTDLNGTLLVQIMNTKTKVDRTFTVTGKYYKISKQYISLRPNACKNLNFFIKYYNGKCSLQNVGINTFGNMGKTVAKYLGLSDPQLYTGHCFRRTSATILIDAGADITTLKRHGGWKSTEVAESYIDNSIQSKMKVSKSIMNSIEMTSSTPNQCTSALPMPQRIQLASNATMNDQSSTSSVNVSELPKTSSNNLSPSPSLSPSPTPATELPKTTSKNLSPILSPTGISNEINLSQILKQHNTPLIITKNNIQNLHIHFHK